MHDPHTHTHTLHHLLRIFSIELHTKPSPLPGHLHINSPCVLRDPLFTRCTTCWCFPPEDRNCNIKMYCKFSSLLRVILISYLQKTLKKIDFFRIWKRAVLLMLSVSLCSLAVWDARLKANRVLARGWAWVGVAQQPAGLRMRRHFSYMLRCVYERETVLMAS